jgi:hypothetical protein
LGKTKETNEKPNPSYQQPKSTNFLNLSGSLMKFFDFFISNFQQAWSEMTGTAKESSLKRVVKQADSYRSNRGNNGNTEEEEDNSYSGPTSIVLVKEPLSAWEHMKNRLQDSPLIQQILKSSGKVVKAVADTSVGKQAQNVTQTVKDKIEDIREFWETSQNPIVYTLANMWDNITGETEEGMTIAQIRKLDPDFVKVIPNFSYRFLQ